jgi:hypothetical protein
MSPSCSLYVPCMSPSCSLHVPCMSPSCSLAVPSAPWVRRDFGASRCTHLLGQMCAGCSLKVHRMFRECSLNVPCMFPECSLTVPSAPWVRSHHGAGWRKHLLGQRSH